MSGAVGYPLRLPLLPKQPPQWLFWVNHPTPRLSFTMTLYGATATSKGSVICLRHIHPTWNFHRINHVIYLTGQNNMTGHSSDRMQEVQIRCLSIYLRTHRCPHGARKMRDWKTYHEVTRESAERVRACMPGRHGLTSSCWQAAKCASRLTSDHFVEREFQTAGIIFSS